MSSGISCFAAFPQRAGVEHQIAVGLESTTRRPCALVRERDAERDPDLGRRADIAARMSMRLVEFRASDPGLERVGAQDPVFVLDDLPYLAGQTRQRQRRGIPVLTRPPATSHPPPRGAPRWRSCDPKARGKPRVGADPFAADSRELREAERRVADRAHRARLPPARSRTTICSC